MVSALKGLCDYHVNCRFVCFPYAVRKAIENAGFVIREFAIFSVLSVFVLQNRRDVFAFPRVLRLGNRSDFRRTRAMSRRIAVNGTVYAGLVTGTGLADFGNNVTCVDVDKKIDMLNHGEICIYESGLKTRTRR